ncbi:MAG: hypothetical protein EOP06_27680, partial [Proteobacteria bacterium]
MKFTKLDYVKALRSSFLSFLADEELQDLIKLGQVVESEGQQRVLRDEQAQMFYLILNGDVTLRQRGSMFEMDRLGYAQSLELKTLLLHVPQWQYEWMCETKCFFFRIPWMAVELVLQKYPEQLQYLARITQSVALQRLKRDLLGLNVSWTTAKSLISKMRQERFQDIIAKAQTGKMIVTVFSGEIAIQVDDGEKPFHLTSLTAGDTSVLDFDQASLSYVPQAETRVWVVTEAEWASLSTQTDFQEFIAIF